MTPAERWLRERCACAPPRLLQTMLAALPPEPLAIPEALGEGALALCRQVLQGTGGREDALPLLAADALLTHAFEAQAEQDPAGIPALVRRAGGAGRLGELAEKATR